MNWTGGGLSRSRNAKGTLSAKQRNYFAKIRGKMQNGRLPRQQVQSFDLGKWKPTVMIKKSPISSDHYSGRAPKQKRLEEFQNVQPIVERLSTLTPRHETSQRKSSVSQLSSNQASQRPGKVSGPIIIGSSQSCASETSSRSRFFNSSRPALSQPKRSVDAYIDAGDSVEAKRRRLLQMENWVGIGRPTTKPLTMKFADPADRNLIGRRRRISKTSNLGHLDRHRLLPRNRLTEIQRRRPTLASRVDHSPHNQNRFEEDISVRIGSAVDRSMRGDTTIRTPRDKRGQGSVFSDELLDDADLVSVHKPSSSRSPATPASQLSGYERREILIPSAFMDDLSSEFSSHSRHDQGISSYELGIRNKVPDATSPRLLDGSDFSDLEVPKEQSPKGFRLVFDSPLVFKPQIPRRDKSGPASCDDADSDEAEPSELSNRSEWSENPNNKQEPGVRRHDENRLSDSWDKGPSRITNVETGFRDKFTKDEICGEHVSAVRQFHNGYTLSQADDGKSVSTITERHDSMPPPNVESQTSQAPVAEDQAWRKFTVLDSHEITESLLDGNATNRDVAAIDDFLRYTPKPTQPLGKGLPESPEDEEAAWRKIVFGDDESIQDASQDTQPHHLACTQPSLIAEVATSPLKQNPHLVNETFASSSSCLPEATLTLDPQEPPTFTHLESQSQDIRDGSTKRSSPATAKRQLPQPWPQQPRSFSLIGEASSSSYHTNQSLPATISSDELHHSPERVPFFPTEPHSPYPNPPNPPTISTSTYPHPTNPTLISPSFLQQNPKPQPQPRASTREKIIYKKPPRYLGSQVSSPPQPTVLGARVLRSGRMVRWSGVGRGRRTGKGEGKGRWGRRNRGDGEEREEGKDEARRMADVVEDEIIDDYLLETRA